MMAPSPTDHAWWLASRAAGVVALALLSLTVAIGLAMASKAFRRPGLGRQLMGAHEQISLAALGAVVVHGATLLGDPWLHPGLTGVTLPFAISYRPAFTALGIVGGYLAALLGLSFYLRRRIGPRLWRRAHKLTVLVWALAMVHVLGAGTDAASPWLRTLLLVAAAPVLLLAAKRALPRPLPTRTAVPSGAPAGRGQ
jgi:sulfoxide reductase heme-binding subunit YedZ